MKNQENQPKTSHVAIDQITADKLDSIITDEKYTIIDVRSAQGIEKQGAIPTAVNIPFESIGAAVYEQSREYNSIFKSNGPFLFCCTGGVMSYAAAIKAHENGIENVYNLEGGHSAWIKLNASVEA